MKRLALLLFLLSAPCFADHDCRIASINIKGSRQGDTLILRAIYRGFDGAPLSQRLCPDQNVPTWGTDNRDVIFLEPNGYKVQIEALNPGELIFVSLSTLQNPDKEFYVEKRFRF